MASGQAFIAKVVGRFLFRQAEAAEVSAVSPHFRRIVLRGEGLRGGGWTPGDKLQVFASDVGMRTYTPLRWNAAEGTTELLAYVHGEGPGSRWAQTLAAGQPCRFVGPRRSLVAAEGERILLFGDETSFAVACALQSSAKVRALFEVSDRSESELVLARMNLAGSTCVRRTPEDGHLATIFAQMRNTLAAEPDTRIVLTGRAQSLQAIRAFFKREGMRPPATVKAYWSVGKRGLD